jgi:hypothetical protein
MQLGVSGNLVKFPSGVRGKAPATDAFVSIFKPKRHIRKCLERPSKFCIHLISGAVMVRAVNLWLATRSLVRCTSTTLFERRIVAIKYQSFFKNLRRQRGTLHYDVSLTNCIELSIDAIVCVRIKSRLYLKMKVCRVLSITTTSEA